MLKMFPKLLKKKNVKNPLGSLSLRKHDASGWVCVWVLKCWSANSFSFESVNEDLQRENCPSRSQRSASV